MKKVNRKVAETGRFCHLPFLAAERFVFTFVPLSPSHSKMRSITSSFFWGEKMKVEDVFEVKYVCIKCNWVRPKGLSCRKCGRCGSDLKKRLVKKGRKTYKFKNDSVM